MTTETILLKDLQELFANRHNFFHSKSEGHQGVPRDHDGMEGEYNESFKFYKHPGLPEGIFMRETWHSDSYGSGDSLISIEFVQGKNKVITVFEPI